MIDSKGDAVTITSSRRPSVEELRELRDIEDIERAALAAWRQQQETRTVTDKPKLPRTLEEAIDRMVAAAPDPTPEQMRAVRALLLGSEADQETGQ